MSDKEMGKLELTKPEELGKWNYTIKPRIVSEISEPVMAVYNRDGLPQKADRISSNTHSNFSGIIAKVKIHFHQFLLPDEVCLEFIVKKM